MTDKTDQHHRRYARVCTYVEEFEETLKVMEVKKKAWPAIRKGHARRLLEAQDAVLLAYYGGFRRGGSVTVKHHLGQDIYG